MTRVLVTGATGYIGGRLVPELLAAGYDVRVLARHPERLDTRPWRSRIEVVTGDASDPAVLTRALDCVDVAYYLIHSMGSGRRFEARDRRTALAFGTACRESGVGRIVYLGGLHPDDEELSPHLGSRREVGEILLASGVPTTVLRAAVIIGSGSASFEMLRYLTERLPVMVTPRWLDTRIQPIAVRDVLRYLVGSAQMPADVNRGFDVGGPDVLTYRAMMQRYAAVAGLRPRRIVTVPLLTPGLSSHWVGLVTPVPSGIARPLVDSLVHEVVCKDHDIDMYVAPRPDGGIGFERAVELALKKVHDLDVSTSWASASTPGAPSDPLPSDPDWSGGSLYVDERDCTVDAPPDRLWQVIEGIGGRRGWYSWRLGWWTRGLLDRVVGGPGLRRGRLHPDTLSVGDPLDWWRVETLERGRLLRLRAEMRLPGEAWLELRVGIDGQGRTLFRQRALFHPRGLPGELYWAAIRPFHDVVFGGMQRNIAHAAERTEEKSMIVIEREVVVATEAERAFDYLADFRTTEQWDPGTVRTTRISGDGGVGTTYHNTSRFNGRETELTYVVEECVRPDRIVLRGENRTIVARDTMTFHSESHLTRVTYRAEFRLKGLARFAEPFLRKSFDRLGDEAEEGLRNALGRLTA